VNTLAMHGFSSLQANRMASWTPHP
jgi:hypothetical protein